MKVTTKKQEVMEDGKVVKTLHFLKFDNEQGQTFEMNVGEKTTIAINKMNELTIKGGKKP